MTPFSNAFNALPFAASGPVSARQTVMGGFLASTAGTLQVRSGPLITDPIAVASLAVVAGQYIFLPFAFANGAFIELGGGATGTLAALI